MRREAIEAELKRLHKHKTPNPPEIPALGPQLINFFRDSVHKRHTRLGTISEYWTRLVPETLQEHCALESFQSGTLKVLVDSSSHLYELKQLLLAGLQSQLLLACRSAGLKKITLKAGRWYDGDGVDKRIRF